MNTKKIYLVLLLALALPVTALGQAQAWLEPDTIALGDQAVLVVRNARTFPSVDQLSQDGVVALGQQFDSAARTMRTLVTSFEPGRHTVRLGDEDSVVLRVADVDIDTTSAEIRDIAPIMKVPYTFWEIFRWVLLALAIGGVAFAVVYLINHRKVVGTLFSKPEPVDTRTPHERASQALEALRGQHLWQGGKVKEYYTELTDIVRRFVEESTGVRATEMTTDETLESLRAAVPSVGAELARLLQTADMVKFAKREPLSHEHDQAMADAVRAVDSLWEAVRPREDEASGGSGKQEGGAA